MSFWDKVGQFEAEKERESNAPFWSKVGEQTQEGQNVYRRLTDSLLDNNRIESLLASRLPDKPLGYQPTEDDRNKLTKVIDDHPESDEFRSQLAVSMYISNAYNEDFGKINSNHKAVVEQLFGEGTTSKQALNKILQSDKKAFGLYRPMEYKGFWQATKDGYNQAGVGMVSEIAGLSRLAGDIGSGWNKEQVEWANNLSEWGDVMYKGVLEHYKAHPEEFIQAQGDGFWDTTSEYIKHPVAIWQGAIQTAPLILEGIVGGVVVGGIATGLGATEKTVKFATWLGRTQALAAPITGRKYGELRNLDVPIKQALPQAFLTGQFEAIIEEWTLGKKLAIFKGSASAAKTGIVNRAVSTIIGGAKAYGRGVAEEGSQQFSENFWNWVFTDRDQNLMENVASSAGAGGPMEMFLSGAFHTAGAAKQSLVDRLNGGNGKQVNIEEKLRRIEVIRESMLDSDQLAPQQRNEINKAADEVKSRIEAGAGEAIDIATPETLDDTNIVDQGLSQPDDVQQVVPKREPQNLAEEIDAVEIVESDEKDIPDLRPEQAGGIVTERIDWVRASGETVQITRGELTTETNRLVADLSGKIANNKINTDADVKQAESDWKDIATARVALGFTKGAKPFKVIRAKKNIVRVIKNTKSRIWAGIKGVKQPKVTVAEALRNVMKGMSKASRQGFVEGARKVLNLHKNLNQYARQQLKGLDITKGQMSKLMTAIAGAKTDAQRLAAHTLIDVLAEQSRQAKAISKLRKTVAYINRKIGLAMQKKGIRPEYYEKVKALTDTFKLKPDSAKVARAVRSLKIHLENIRGALRNQYGEQHEIEMIPESMIKRLDKIDATPVQEMKALEIEFLDDTLKQLINNNDTKNRLILDGVAREIATVLNGAVEEMDNVIDNSIDESGKPTTEQKISPHGVLNSFIAQVAGKQNHKLETLIDTVAGGQLGYAYNVFVEGVSDGRNKAFEYENTVRDKFAETMDKHNITFEDLQKMSSNFLRAFKGEQGKAIRRWVGNLIGKQLTPELHTVKVAGKNQTFTTGELMMFFMHAQSGYNLSAITGEGVATRNKNLGKVSIKELIAITDIIESNPKAKAFVEMAADIYENVSKVEINKVSRGLMGIDIAKEENWAHIDRFTTGGVGGAQRYILSDLEQLGLLQERVGSKNPIVIHDFFQQFFVDMTSVAEYVGMAEPLRNARDLINYKAYRDVVREKGYDKELSQMDSAIKRIQSLPEPSEAIDHVVSFLMRGTIRAILAEPGIILGQYPSVNGIFNEMSRKYSSALRITSTTEQRARYKKNMPSYKFRLEMGMSSQALGFIGEGEAVSKAFAGKGDLISTFTRAIHGVDSLAVTDIARAIEAEMVDKNMDGKSREYWENRGVDPTTLEVGSEQYWKEVQKRWNFIVRRTQPMSTPESKTANTGTKSATKKMFHLFRSYVDQPLNMAHRSITSYRNGKTSLGQLSADLGNIYATLAMYTAVRFATALVFFRKDDDWKDLVFSLFVAPVRLLAWIGFPTQLILKNAFEKTRKPEISTVPLSFANKVLQSASLMAEGVRFSITGEVFQSGPNKGKPKGLVKLHKGFLELIQSTLMFYGVPEDVPRKFYNGWIKKNPEKVSKF